MSGLLDALHQRTPLPSWAAPPAPLPVGPYPRAKWPDGLTHLQPALADAEHIARLIRAGAFTPAQFVLLVSVIANKVADLNSLSKAVDHLDIAAAVMEASQ